jgi:hypothetical protein
MISQQKAMGARDDPDKAGFWCNVQESSMRGFGRKDRLHRHKPRQSLHGQVIFVLDVFPD